jgi:hypothetical protein
VKLFVTMTPTPNGNEYFAVKTNADVAPTGGYGWFVWSKHDAEQLASKLNIPLVCEYPEWNQNKPINPFNKVSP